jgi:hypothetical protein
LAAHNEEQQAEIKDLLGQHPGMVLIDQGGIHEADPTIPPTPLDGLMDSLREEIEARREAIRADDLAEAARRRAERGPSGEATAADRERMRQQVPDPPRNRAERRAAAKRKQ